MTSLLVYRAALDELQALFNQGLLSRDAYLLARRSLNNNAFKSIMSRAREESTEEIYEEARQADMTAVVDAVMRQISHEDHL